MSPRSEEFMAGARDGLVAARAALEAGSSRGATSAAYSAMLYAARAALSEADRNAKTHSGTWGLFKQAFVDTGRFSDELFGEARRTQPTREAADLEEPASERSLCRPAALAGAMLCPRSRP